MAEFCMHVASVLLPTLLPAHILRKRLTERSRV